jgi:hypothetical protein
MEGDAVGTRPAQGANIYAFPSLASAVDKRFPACPAGGSPGSQPPSGCRLREDMRAGNADRAPAPQKRAFNPQKTKTPQDRSHEKHCYRLPMITLLLHHCRHTLNLLLGDDIAPSQLQPYKDLVLPCRLATTQSVKYRQQG